MFLFGHCCLYFAFNMNFVVRNSIFKNIILQGKKIKNKKKFQRTVGEGVVKWLFVAFLALKDTLVKTCIGIVVFINIKHKNSIILANKCQFVCDKFVFIWEILKRICACYLNCNYN